MEREAMMVFRCCFCGAEMPTTRRNVGKLVGRQADGGLLEMCLRCGDERFALQDMGWAALDKISWVKLRKMRRERGDGKLGYAKPVKRAGRGQGGEQALERRMEEVVAQALNAGVGLGLPRPVRPSARRVG